MGINIHFFATTPGDLRAWALDRLPSWWCAWTGAHADFEFPPPESDAWHHIEAFDRLADLVDRVRPESPPGPGGCYHACDRPTRAVFGRALRLLRSGASAWEARRPREAAVMDDLVRQLLRDTDYHQRHRIDGDPVTSALAPVGPARSLGGDLHLRWNQIPPKERLSPRASPALRRLWGVLTAGRTVAVVTPEHVGAWGDQPVEACAPDEDDSGTFGWYAPDECATLLSELAPIEGEPLVPQPISGDERRALVELKTNLGEAMWKKVSAQMEARAREFIPYDRAEGVHVIRDVVAEAQALGCGLGFFTG